MIDEDSKTLWCGNLSEQVSEEILYELFLQAGPLEKVRIPRDRDGRPRNFAFITYCHDVSVPFAINLFRGTALFQRTLSLQCRARMAPLPPPIRCASLDQPLDNTPCPNIRQQFADMTQSIEVNDYRSVSALRQGRFDDLVMSSLQGNWSHRHHPYNRSNNDTKQMKNEDRKHSRDDFHGKRDNEDHGRRRGWRDRDRGSNSSGRYDSRNTGRTNHQKR